VCGRADQHRKRAKRDHAASPLAHPHRNPRQRINKASV
jgi:hypothetical protein